MAGLHAPGLDPGDPATQPPCVRTANDSTKVPVLTPEENARLTRVGPGTPMGEYMRRYWQPVCLSQELTDVPKAIKILQQKLKENGVEGPEGFALAVPN